MARKFFYICAGMLMLALSYHFGANTATAQAPSNPVVAMSAGAREVITANGDLYVSLTPTDGTPYRLVQNVFGGGPMPALRESWGQVKERFRNTPRPAQPGAQDR